MKKTIICMLLVFFSTISANVYADENDAISEKYDQFYFDSQRYNHADLEIDANSTADATVERLFSKLADVFCSEIIECRKIFLHIILICIISALFKSFVSGSELSGIGTYSCYCASAYLVVQGFNTVSDLCKGSVTNLNDFMNISFPAYASVLGASGYAGSAVSMQSIFMIISIIITNIIVKIVFPLLYLTGIIAVVNGISTTINLSKFIKTVSKTTKYLVGILMTVFAGILTFTGFNTSGTDNIALRTAKYAVSNFIPVVGGCLSDAINSVIHSSAALKGSMGYVCFFTLISICLIPIIKSAIIIILYRLCSSVTEIFGQTSVGQMLDSVCNVLVTMVSLLLIITVIFILIIAIIASIG